MHRHPMEHGKASNTFEPLVSIVIPVYNGSDYMREAIDSALAQTYGNIEVIVVNDGSTDGGKTDAIAHAYGDDIRYFFKENGGVATALNMGIEKMRGEYFSWLSHDDVYLPDKVSKQIQSLVMENNPNAIVFCDYSTIDAGGRLLKEYRLRKTACKSMKCFLATDIQTGLHGCSLLVPKLFFDTYGVFCNNLKCTQDYDLWLRFTECCDFIHTPEVLVYSRQHSGQGSKTMRGMCLAEADLLLSNAVASLTKTDFINLAGEDSLKYFFEAYESYEGSGYLKTAIRLFEKLCNYTTLPGDQQSIAKIITEYLLQTPEQHPEVIRQLAISSKEKPRLLFFSNVWWGGGIEIALQSLMNHLSSQYDVMLLTFDWKREGELRRCDGVTHLYMGYSLDFVGRIAMLACLLKVDIFIGNPNHDVQFLNIYKLLHDLKIKTIAYNHGNYFLPFCRENLYSLYSARNDSYKYANVVVWLTKLSTQIYNTLHDNGAYLPHCITLSNNNEFPPSDDKIILAVGRFYDSIKRVDRILKVFQKVAMAHPDAKLHLLGGFDLQTHVPEDSPYTIQDLLDSLNIPISQVVFLGEHTDTTPFYSRASLLVHTSESEGSSLVLNEAGAFRLPTVVFDIPGIEDIITDTQNGFIVIQGDIDEMANKIILLLNNEDLRQKMGECAANMVLRFSKEIVYPKWNKLFQCILEHNNNSDDTSQAFDQFKEPIIDHQDFTRRVISSYDSQVTRVFQNFSIYCAPKLHYYSENAARKHIKDIVSSIKALVQLVRANLKSNGPIKTGAIIFRKLFYKAS